jgi:tetratricopeptide (TPR) repeat protein
MRLLRSGVPPLALALIAGILYVSTLAPGVGAGDSGELTLAARDLGIPHPPGYPLWTMLARLFVLLPFGDVPFRVNLLSAVLAAASVGVFHAIAVRLGLRAFSALLATACFAGSVTIWRSAVEAEVYALAIAFFLALTWLALEARSSRGRFRRIDALVFFASGMAPLVHQTLVLPAALFSIWILDRGLSVRRAARAAGFGLLGLSLVLVVAVRSAANPAFSFGGMEPGLWGALDGLLRQGYGPLRQGPPGFDRLMHQVGGLASGMAASVGIAAAIFAVIGALRPGREGPGLRLVSIASLTIPAALVALIGFDPDPEHFAQVAPFLAPVVASLSLLAGAGAGSLLRRVPTAVRVPATGAVLTCAAATLLAHAGLCDRSGYRLADRYARDLLAPLPQGATLVLDGDNETFLAAYATRLRGLRPDVALIHRRGYVFGDVYGLAGAPRSRWAEIATGVDLARLRTGRDVYYAAPPADLAAAGAGFVQQGLVSRALSPAAARARLAALESDPARAPLVWLPPEGWPKSSDLLPGRPSRYDYVTRKMAVSYSDAAARALWSAGRYEEALPWFQDAARIGYDFVEARLNLATAAAAVGRADLTLAQLLKARSLAPLDPEPAARLAVFLGSAGRHKDAALWFERAYRIAPDATVASDAARAWWRAGDNERARYWQGLTG